jgi:hypothetical protein
MVLQPVKTLQSQTLHSESVCLSGNQCVNQELTLPLLIPAVLPSVAILRNTRFDIQITDAFLLGTHNTPGPNT